MNVLNKIRNSKFGMTIIIVAVVGVVALVGIELIRLLGTNDPASEANHRVFMCSETMRSFSVDLSDLQDASIPIKSPYSGKFTGYPAELCYWTRDGQIKKDPTPVLLNQSLGKEGPTFCPDCGRLVVGHNPVPTGNSHPPPTREEWSSMVTRGGAI